MKSALVLLLALLATPVFGDETRSGLEKKDLTEVPIEQLLNIEVTTPTRRPEKLSATPAAIAVITQEDIHRSGATSIPEALRLVPGLDVAQEDSQQWAISARGFNDIFANKLLVLQDGRSLYTPLFSGVFWNVQDTLMEDIDRIEVIRGPGASLWGANAVNGIINIITKSAKDTQGLLVTGGGGNVERGFGGVRYGLDLGGDVYVRVYGKYFNRGDAVLPNGGDAEDSWQRGQGGFRLDWDTTEKNGNLLTVQGDGYGSIGNQTFTNYAPGNVPTFYQAIDQDNYRTAGGNLLGRWSHTISDTADLKVQAYYDRTEQDTIIFKETRDTFDLDLQHHFGLGSWNDVIWGGGYRLSADRLGQTPTISFSPADRSLQLFSAFVQDELTIVPARLRLTLGTKLEHNDFTGFEVQPNGRLLWTPSANQTLWFAASRAVRTPSQGEDSITLRQPMPPQPLVVDLRGNPRPLSEDLLAFEPGYRVRPRSDLSFDLAAFYDLYHRIRSEDVGQPFAPGPGPIPIFLPATFGNDLCGDTYGFELAAVWQLSGWWRLHPSYTLLKTHMHKLPSSTDMTSVAFYEGSSPQQQAALRSSMDLPWRLSLDANFRYVDRLPALAVTSYVALDVRVAWQATSGLELAVVGQNLLNNHHGEFAPTFVGTPRTEVPWGIYGQVTWWFGGKH